MYCTYIQYVRTHTHTYVCMYIPLQAWSPLDCLAKGNSDHLLLTSLEDKEDISVVMRDRVVSGYGFDVSGAALLSPCFLSLPPQLIPPSLSPSLPPPSPPPLSHPLSPFHLPSQSFAVYCSRHPRMPSWLRRMRNSMPYGAG